MENGQAAQDDPAAAAAEGGLVMAPGSPLEAAVRMAAAAAPRDCPVFLRGESGSGKELMARFLHLRSPRRSGPFVAVNCGAIPPQLIESELFGHRKGAFTGALEDNPGRFRLAAGGTLFLDEVGDMPLDAQTRLLRALQEKAVCPVGGRGELPVDFRLVCATHRDLRAAVDAGRFREDLYFRIAVVEVRLPPLRERPADVPLLLRRFLEELLGPGEARRAMADLPPGLAGMAWPGNVRELRNLVERYAVLRDMGGGWEEAAGVTRAFPGGPPGAGTGPAGDMPASILASTPAPIPAQIPALIAAPSVPAADPPRRVRNSRVTDDEILQALASCGYHRARASLRLGITRRALQYRLAKLAPPEETVRPESARRAGKFEPRPA